MEEIVFSTEHNVVRSLTSPDSSSERDSDVERKDDPRESKKTSPAKKPAWVDEDDEILVSEGMARADKLPKKVVGEQKYKTYLEQKFETIYKKPKWADPSVEKNKRHQNDSSEDDDDDIPLSSVARKISTPGKKLTGGKLNFKKCAALNEDMKRHKPYDSIVFHPKYEIGIVSTANIVDVFKVQNKGKFSTDRRIKSYAFEQTRIERIVLTPDGKELILGPKFYIKSANSIDMETGIVSTFSLVKGGEKIGLRRLCMSQDGKFLACKADHGQLYVMDVKTKEFIQSFQMNDEVEALCFSSDCQNLISHGAGGQCYIWSLKGSKLVNKFYDEGTVVGVAVAASPNEQFLATGSESGVVNLYDYDTVLKNENPQPLKSFMNLTTSVSAVTFNHSSELMAFCSMGKTNSVKIAHVASRSVFANFPFHQESYGRVAEVRFSPSSGFFALGGNIPVVPLFRLCHFDSY